MGRRKKEGSTPKSEVAVSAASDANYLIQPLELTMMKGELSQLEVNIIVEVIDHLQERLVQQRNELMSGKQLSLFDFNEEVIQLPLDRFGVLPCDYWRLDEAAKKLSNFKVFHRFKDELGNWVDGYSTVFPDAGISKTSLKADGTAYKYKGGARTVGYMRISVNKTVAPKFLNISKEYTRFLKNATRGRRCMYTPRMVMFISSYRERGWWQIEYDEFRRLIGLLYNEEVTVVDDATGKPKKRMVECEKKGYTKFSDVKRRIIEPAREEMKDMCEKRIMDCYFEYEAIYPGGKTKGVPDALLFHIHKGPLGLEDDAKKTSRKEYGELSKYLVATFGMATSSVKTLLSKVNDGNREEFKKKAEEVAAHIAKKGGVDSPSGYAYTSLMDFLNTQELRDKSQTLDFTEAEQTVDNTPNNENVCNLSPNEKEPQMMNPMWDAALIKMQLRMPSNIYNAIAGELQFESFENGTLLLSFKSDAFFQWLEGNEGNIIELEHYTIYGEEIFEAFGKDTQINYKQRKN